MVIDIGGNGIDLEKVQVHPTGSSLLLRFSCLSLYSIVSRISHCADDVSQQVSSILTSRTPKSSSSPPKRFVESEDCCSIERVTDSPTSWVTEITYRNECGITTNSRSDLSSTARRRRKLNGTARFVLLSLMQRVFGLTMRLDSTTADED